MRAWKGARARRVMKNSEAGPEAGKSRRSTFENIARYSSGNIYRQLTGVVSAILKPRFLAPDLYGLWNLLSLISEYSIYADLGAMDAMRYAVPYEEGKKDREKVREIMCTVFWGTAAIRLVIVACLVTAAMLMDVHLIVRIGLLTVAADVLLKWYAKYYSYILMAYHRFQLLANASYIRSTFAVTVGLALIYAYTIYGVYLTAVISGLLVAWYMRKKYPLSTPFQFNAHTYLVLVRRGWAIMGFNFLLLLMRSIDRVVVARYLGVTELGYYGIVGMILVFLLEVPAASRSVIEPLLMEELSTTGKSRVIEKYFIAPLLNTAYYMPFLVIPAFFFLPVVIPVVLPRYVPSILPTQIAVMGAYIFSMVYVSRGVVVAFNWTTAALSFMLGTAALHVALSIFLIRAGYGLPGVAGSMAVSFLVLLVLLLTLVVRRSGISRRKWARVAVDLGIPCVTLSSMLLAGERIALPVSPYADAAVKVPVMCVIMFLLTRWAAGRNPLLASVNLKKFLKKKMSR